MKSILRTARSLPAIAALIAAAALLIVGVQGMNAYRAAHAAIVSGPSPGQLAVALRQVGLDPDALAAAGLTAQQTTTLVAAARTHLDEHFPALRQAQQDYAQARAAHDQLKRLVRAGRASRQQREQLDQAATELAQAAAQLEQQRQALSQAATDHLGSAARVAIATIHAHNRWSHPVPYRAAARPEPDWVALRDALAHVRIAEQRSQDPEPEVLQLIAQADAHPDVAAAKTNLENNLQTVTNAWNAAIYD
jgi:hypothetical protein